jgi:hypothetical protein
MMLQVLKGIGTNILIALAAHLVRRKHPMKRRKKGVLQSINCIARGASIFFSAR